MYIYIYICMSFTSRLHDVAAVHAARRRRMRARVDDPVYFKGGWDRRSRTLYSPSIIYIYIIEGL